MQSSVETGKRGGYWMAISRRNLPPEASRRSRTCRSLYYECAFGSRLARDGEHLEPDPVEQAVLPEIRPLRSQSTTLRGIAVALNHRKFQTCRGTAWRLESVARIVSR